MPSRLVVLSALSFLGVLALVDPCAAQERVLVRPDSARTWNDMLLLDKAQRGPAVQRAVPFLEIPGSESAGGTYLDQPGGPEQVGGAAPSSLSSCPGFSSEPPLPASFLALADNTTWIPPDTMGSVGPSHVMTSLNGTVGIRTRSGTSLSSVTLQSFWGLAVGADVFDPKTFYDASAGRWYSVACADRSTASSRVLFAVSQTNDPTGLWTFYGIDGDPTDTTWVDFPNVGFNGTWVAITMNMFTIAGSFVDPKMWVIDRASALAGGTLTITVFNPGFDTAGAFDGGTLVPCVTMDPGEATLYIVDNKWSIGGVKHERLSRITGTGPSPAWSVVPGSSTAGSGLFAVVNNYDFTQIAASQKDTASRIDTGNTRVLSAMVRNGRVWFTHTGGLPVGAVDRTAVFWYQVNPAAFPAPIVQSGVLDGGVDVHHFFPSIAVNCGNDACVGFSRSDATRFAEACYVVRLASQAAGTTGPVRVLKAGESTYFKTFGGTRVRWGDFSATVIDPQDDRTFWTLQEYAATRVNGTESGSRWGTWWGRIGECGAPIITSHPSSTSACLGGSVSFSVTATTTQPPLTYQWRKNGSNLAGQVASTLTLSPITLGSAGTYSVIVRDDCGSLVSAPAVLTVNTAVSITQHPSPQDICLGSPATFSVSATGTAPLTYQWRKDGSDLTGETGVSLALPAAALADGGSYDVVVGNVCGALTSSAASLTVDEAFSITSDPASQLVCEGSTVMFSVGVSHPGVSYQWRRNLGGNLNVLLPGQTGSSLTLAAVTPSAAGSYDVVVSNACGSLTSAAAVLSVETPAVIVAQPQHRRVCAGHTFALHVGATGTNLTFQWRKNGMDLFGQTTSALLFASPVVADSGVYDVVVGNACGSVTSAPVSVLVAPYPLCKVLRF